MSDSDRNLTVNIRLLAAQANDGEAAKVVEAYKGLDAARTKSADLAGRMEERVRRDQLQTVNDLLSSIQKESQARIQAANVHEQAMNSTGRASLQLAEAQQRAADAAAAYAKEVDHINQLLDAGVVVTYDQAIAKLTPKVNALAEATKGLAEVEEKQSRWLAIARSRAERAAAQEEQESQARAKRLMEEQERQRNLIAVNEKMEQSQKRILSSVAGLSRGLTQLARSYVLLTVSNEENAQKALQMIAGFEGLVQSLNGVVNVVTNANDLWKEYRRLVLLASEADGIKAASGALLNLGGGGGGGIGGGIANTAGKSLPYLLGAGARNIGKGLLNAGRIAGRVGGAVAPIVSAYYLSQTMRTLGGIGYESAMGTANDKGSFTSRATGEDSFLYNYFKKSGAVSDYLLPDSWSGESGQVFRDLRRTVAKLERGQERFSSNFFQNRETEAALTPYAQFMAGRGKTGLDKEQAMVDEAIRRNTMMSTGISTGLLTNQLGEEDREKAKQLDIQNIQERMRLEEQLHQIKLRTIDEELRGAEERQRAAQILIGELEQQRNLMLSNAERFVFSSPLEQKLTLNAYERFQAGEDLAPNDLRRIKGFAGVDQEQYAKTLLQKSLDLGGGKLAGTEDFESVQQKLAEARLDLKTESKIVIELKDQQPELVRKATEEFEKTLNGLQERLLRQVVGRQEFQKFINDFNAKMGQL